jgi:hypothetical protein
MSCAGNLHCVASLRTFAGSKRVWILFVGDGRVGNQVFQYAALSALAPKARIFAFGLEDLAGIFDLRGPRCHVWRGIWLKRVIWHLLRPLLLRPMARWLRLFGYARERETQGPHAGSDGAIEVRRGLIPGLLFVDGGHYQNSEYWPRLFPPACLEVKPALRAQARALLESRLGERASGAFFLHVRRGDYLGFHSHGVHELLLPPRYFVSAVEAMRARGPRRPLVVVTDDVDWVERELGHVPDRVVVSTSPKLDFAVMAECAAGVVSNSTFSLAAAMFMRSPDVVYAPQYWFGFTVLQWLPPRIRFSHERIVYLPVAA